MKILVTGGSGNVGSTVVTELLKRGADVRVLARKQPEAGKTQVGVEVALGDLLDPVSVELAMKGVDKLFLLNAVIPDELTQALIAYGIAKRIGMKHVTYLSVFKVNQFRDVPHFASKLAVESALREFAVPYTILRPGYYIQNDLSLKEALTGPGVYPMPIGTAGIAAADIRDIAEAAAISLTEAGHDGQTYDIVGSQMISGPGNAALWGKLLGKEIKYAGHDFDRWEAGMLGRMPSWSAYDLRMMFQGYFDRGFASTETEVARVTKLLGHAPRSYDDFAKKTAIRLGELSIMPETKMQYPPIPPDDLTRRLAFANPDQDGKLPHIGLVGDTYTITVDGDDTSGRFCVVDMHIPHGGGPGPHRHDFEETFIVLNGEIEASFRGKKSVVHAGETINIPANASHMFHNTSGSAVRLLCICSPAGQEKFFLEIGVVVATRTAVPPELSDEQMAAFLEKAKALAPKYKTELLKEA